MKLAKDMKFAQMLLTRLNLVELSSHMIEDIAGDSFLSRNLQARNINKYMSLKHIS